MGLKSFPSLILIFLAGVLISLRAQADFKTPPLTIKEYKSLGFPPQLNRTEIEESLTLTAQRLYGEAFVDLGAMSDLMHAHALFYPLNDSDAVPEKGLNEKDAKISWQNLRLKALLFHTQEYPFLRENREYRNAKGELLDPLNRNWLIWSMESEFGVKGDLMKANVFDRRGRAQPMTISAGDLLPAVFGDHARSYEYSFYFFRVRADDIVALGISEERLAASNILKIPLGKEVVYLALVNFHCRHHPEDKAVCGGDAELSSYY